VSRGEVSDDFDMTDNVISIVEEPQGETYLSLLQFALNSRSTFSLVWREQFAFDASAREIDDALRVAFVREIRTSEWPGTVLLADFATVRFYQMSPETLLILGKVLRLYAWGAPERPEDLAFYADGGQPRLASISHECDAFIFPSATNMQRLAVEVPSLHLAST